MISYEEMNEAWNMFRKKIDEIVASLLIDIIPLFNIC